MFALWCALILKPMINIQLFYFLQVKACGKFLFISVNNVWNK